MANRSLSLITIISCFTIGIVGLIGCSLMRGLFTHTGFTVSYSGAYDGKFAGDGFFSPCTQTNDSQPYPMLHLQDDRIRNWIAINFATETSPGTYSFERSGTLGKDYLSNATITSPNDELLLFSSEELVSGQISFEDLPDKSDPVIRGSFAMTFVDSANSDIIIRFSGRFDFKVADSSYDCSR